jgi:DNA repair protein SbcC/Rad50
MIIKKLTLQNIRSFENLEIEFPKGSILLTGDIGSGKTSILLGIQFALFGLQPGQKGSSLLRQGANEAYARIEIEIDNETINLERSIKKSKSGSITQEKNIFTKDKERTELSTSEMKTKVIEILNYPKEFAKKSNLLYKFTVYTPQEAMKEIIEERPEIRLDTIRHIFGVDRYKRIKENLSIIIQKIKESIKIKEILITELSLLREKLRIETEKKILLARELNNLNYEFVKTNEEKEKIKKEKQELEIIQERNNQIINEIQKKEAQKEGKKALEERLKKEIILMQKEADKEIDFSEERLKSLSSTINQHKNRLEEKQKEYMEINNTLSVLESKREISENTKEKIISINNCPTCFQEVSTEHKEKIKKRTEYDLEEIKLNIQQKLIQKNQTIKEIEKQKELINNYEKDKQTLEHNKIKFEYQRTIQTKIKSDAFVLDRTTNEITTLENNIKELKSQKQENIDNKYKEIRLIFEEITNNLQKKEIELAQKNKEMELLKRIIEDLSKDITKKEKIKEELMYHKELLEWLQEKFFTMITITEKNVLSKIKEEFSKIFSEWFNLLVSQELTVSLNQDFTPVILNQDYEMDYSFLSGGERTAVAISYRLAINKVLNLMLSKIKTRNLVILDEPTDGFSSEQVDKMRDLFEELKAKQLIIVSHEQKIEGFVDNVIKVKKDFTSTTEKITKTTE